MTRFLAVIALVLVGCADTLVDAGLTPTEAPDTFVEEFVVEEDPASSEDPTVVCRDPLAAKAELPVNCSE